MTATSQKTAATPVRSPAQFLRDMLHTIDTLRNIYVTETVALKAADTKAFFSLQDSKIQVAQKYHDDFNEFLRRKDEIVRAQPDIKKILARKQAEFSKVSSENLAAITRMNRVVDRLGKRIMRLASETATREAVAYGASGSMSLSRNRPVTTGVNESA